MYDLPAEWSSESSIQNLWTRWDAVTDLYQRRRSPHPVYSRPSIFGEDQPLLWTSTPFRSKTAPIIVHLKPLEVISLDQTIFTYP
ncbi:hypothetical protein MPTK1_8g08760 [Marchantia polymorpha subsp. ruderalis]|uniref:Uncharacterized protein n=1 Tax=Marchantia polymorpha TaxID=3197 RepID=A0A2R6WRM4_MARPO|nr:hypothetical protein MARPO_0063s0043 [Marchantia polymorpha]BBN19216.1 hypothetical protein Mp_8g08760 [Marchantia polymorpha subsp. ruderalis]|eukprot:PTQ36496.1 hypothetical protein MARPO_0063s0043 [Marchantia polymorpha]